MKGRYLVQNNDFTDLDFTRLGGFDLTLKKWKFISHNLEHFFPNIQTTNICNGANELNVFVGKLSYL